MASIRNLTTLLSSSAKLAREIVETAAANKQKVCQELTEAIKKETDDILGDQCAFLSQKAERMDMIKSKIGKYLNLMGDQCEMKNDAHINLGNDWQISFRVNGKHKVGRQVVLKDADEKLELFFDGKGVLRSGDLTEGSYWGSRLTFNRNQRNVRRFNYRGVDYAPVGNSDNMWTPVVATSENLGNSTCNLSSQFEHRYYPSVLLDLFFDLANKSSKL